MYWRKAITDNAADEEKQRIARALNRIIDQAVADITHLISNRNSQIEELHADQESAMDTKIRADSVIFACAVALMAYEVSQIDEDLARKWLIDMHGRISRALKEFMPNSTLRFVARKKRNYE